MKKINKEITSSKPVRVGISIGDINGIGPEVIMKSLNDNRLLFDFTPVIYGSSKVFSFYKKRISIKEFVLHSCSSIDDIKPRKVNIINLWDGELKFDLGKPTFNSGKLAFESLEAATSDLAKGKIDVLVTSPISKDAMNQFGFKFPGHTEYLADMSGQEDALMLMVESDLRVGLVSSHIPLKEVSQKLTADKIQNKIKSFSKTLITDFGILRPKIAVLGLNPHSGESGKIGSEELDIIIPSIEKVKEDGIIAMGPFPADGFFGSNIWKNYDGILAMYHDQGLAPFKAISFHEGVNFTAGLPIVRTSPDHGTAYDIVGQDKASGNSMRNAIYTAIDVFRNRQLNKEINSNKLQKQELQVDKKNKKAK